MARKKRHDPRWLLRQRQTYHSRPDHDPRRSRAHPDLNQTYREARKTYLSQITSAPVDRYSSNARLAFYINAYNAIVLDSILSKWPVKSVMTLDGFFDKDKHTIAGQTMTLDELEHNKIG